jgi:hypothetical protein
MLLDTIYAKGLAKTAENVEAIRTLLASKVTTDEQVGLVRILGRISISDDKAGSNPIIAEDLRRLVYTGHQDVATAATLAFSRLGYFQDSRAVLQYAKDKHYIDVDGYYGELAHLVSFAPAHDQVDMVSEIRSARNQYAIEILASMSKSAGFLPTIHPETQRALKQCLEENEPDMEKALGSFGGTDRIIFENWLDAVGTLSVATSTQSYSDAVFPRLNDESIDPRKIMAFLSSFAGKRFISDVGRKAPFENMMKRATHYSRQFPQNVHMRDAVQEITIAVNSLER